MINALIIDDEVKARHILANYLETMIPEEMTIRQARSVDQAVEVMKTFKPGIIFLDVEMPGKFGFELLAGRKNPDFDIVFITAFNKYAIQAIRFSALDYLLKPICVEELRCAIERHIEKVKEKNARPSQMLLDNLMDNIKKKEIKDFRLAVPSSEGVFFFMLDEILRLEADKNYTSIHLVGKRPFVSSKTLKHFDEMLADFNFIRTHKSHLVNSRYIKQVSHNSQYVLLSDGSQVEVSRRKKEEVQQQLNLR